jgi:CBS-domain-containing membrane protein
MFARFAALTPALDGTKQFQGTLAPMFGKCDPADNCPTAIDREHLGWAESVVIAANFAIVLLVLGLAVKVAWPPSYCFPLINSVALLSMSPWSQPARPWPVIAGHALTASAGVSFGILMGPSLLTGVAAAVTGVFAMAFARASHPPAAATALLLAIQPNPSFSALPALVAGAFVVATLACATRSLRQMLRERTLSACTKAPATPPKSNSLR